ncbi:hypothetical protein [Stieleria varia]|uniref:Uncharacterized protein n=1 Tax=Stieleria varia TaxID=2528005 RepID=A0A5C6B2E1_9BACT|nr:hypothetical protein [Stieleria varia]TWU05582.1 hypothetical protein Pla52n_12970 [Stieleria varia]
MSSPAAANADPYEPGQLLAELEQRQDDVLAQLDALDAQLSEVLKGLEISVDEDPELGDEDS